MRAVVCREYGTPEDLVLVELPDPTPGPGQVVVRVRAAAVNYPDVLMIAGRYQIKVPPPFSPGSEMAGEVLAVGEGVVDYQPGDRVSATTFVGSFAEQAVVDARGLTPVPDGVDYADAAAFGVTNRTAYYTLRTVAPVQPGDWVVVLGAGGGVGLAAVDIAVMMGAKVIAAASGPEKLEVCRQRGAQAVVDYDREDLKARLKEITGEGGSQIVVDPVGGPYSEPALRSLGRGGKFVTLGYAAGSIPAIPLNLVLLKGITVQGMEIRTFMIDYPDEIARDDAELAQLFAEGRLRPYIGARFPLDQAATALRYVADRKAIGKVVIDVA
ncbi:NADPH:quinone oxidoreductase family protein [Mycobacterium sp. CVI_P3]|uniref:NADPH:quinone oxidoreductase family protein n=1 Tax=Mycobacterium pinniadriaticum TaxID=2994102 RepID=A0ABT3SGY6_9MYCO|nr:NADPH:quinone oxidoreductase family protein [Mycobacterium pinniadriaticum]MCX2932004.1 NADPH:quinone oxidoreductase family protein [Mycobacterium pinniadriaticum]MCX2938428.1 NADPH:quinone oxidoreductase family protein [Mycobacterium pinniadriaticum]